MRLWDASEKIGLFEATLNKALADSILTLINTIQTVRKQAETLNH
jgi:hypothetical protein